MKKSVTFDRQRRGIIFVASVSFVVVYILLIKLQGSRFLLNDPVTDGQISHTVLAKSDKYMIITQPAQGTAARGHRDRGSQWWPSVMERQDIRSQGQGELPQCNRHGRQHAVTESLSDCHGT